MASTLCGPCIRHFLPTLQGTQTYTDIPMAAIKNSLIGTRFERVWALASLGGAILSTIEATIRVTYAILTATPFGLAQLEKSIRGQAYLSRFSGRMILDYYDNALRMQACLTNCGIFIKEMCVVPFYGMPSSTPTGSPAGAASGSANNAAPAAAASQPTAPRTREVIEAEIGQVSAAIAAQEGEFARIQAQYNSIPDEPANHDRIQPLFSQLTEIAALIQANQDRLLALQQELRAL